MNDNTGHGHVWERPDGVKARCGGPGLCKVCSEDLLRYTGQKKAETKIKPLRDYIVFEPITKPGKVGLIHIPDATKSTRNQTFQYAKVLAAGPKVELARAGTMIYISEYAVDPFEVDGKLVHMVRERDIVGVVQPLEG